jgi:hypothetical protein
MGEKTRLVSTKLPLCPQRCLKTDSCLNTGSWCLADLAGTSSLENTRQPCCFFGLGTSWGFALAILQNNHIHRSLWLLNATFYKMKELGALSSYGIVKLTS